MFKNLLMTFAVALFTFTLASAHPELARTNKEETKQALPDLAMQCQFGAITQFGPSIQISGNPSWTALGVLRNDGKIQVLWTRGGSLEPLPGVYEFKDGKLIGHYGYALQSWIDDKGELAGTRNPETLYKVTIE